MEVTERRVFNLMDTNGRRNDVINALHGYISILDDIISNQKCEWGNLPQSTAQLEFYKRARALSPDVFKKHEKCDEVLNALEKIPELKAAIEGKNFKWLQEHLNDYSDWKRDLDKNIEQRARHYTSNLVKLGFTDKCRKITEIGNILLDNSRLHKDKLEQMLPFKAENIIYLRQLLKLRIFENKGTRYYSPFCMAIYALMKKQRISQDEFCDMIQGLTPYHKIKDVDDFLDNHKIEDILQPYYDSVPCEIDNDNEIDEETFNKHFKNRKSNKPVKKYYEFYKSLRAFVIAKSNDSLNTLLAVYENDTDKLDKAFGMGSKIFENRRGNRPSVGKFLKAEKIKTEKEGVLKKVKLDELNAAEINAVVYSMFSISKTVDTISEYSDTTKRIFKATGLISFKNGYAELVCRDLCDCIFDLEIIKSMIVGDITSDFRANSFEAYEGSYGSYFCQEQSVASILGYKEKNISNIFNEIKAKFGTAKPDEVHKIILERRKSEFNTFVEQYYPEKRVKSLLDLLSDRKNDDKVKKLVCPEATVPTIYEYVVGLAWYYFSNKTIDLLNSYNLTLSSDFEPLLHAGGGKGDIVIYEDERVVMLEATLMNTSSQKRGEWEPVLRHSVNLKVEEESGKNRDVTTFFIADSFDANTINIWKAVCSVPLQSSEDKTKYTESVIIMPISSNELSKLIDRKGEYGKIIQQIRALFLKDITHFDKDWRERFIMDWLA